MDKLPSIFQGKWNDIEKRKKNESTKGKNNTESFEITARIKSLGKKQDSAIPDFVTDFLCDLDKSINSSVT